MQMQQLTIADPPPLLSANGGEHGRLPLESLSVNHPDAMKMQKGGSKIAPRQALAQLHSVWVSAEARWNCDLQRVQALHNANTRRAEMEAAKQEERLAELSMSLHMLQQSIAQHIFRKSADKVCRLLTEAANSTNPDSIISKCSEVKASLQAHSDTTAPIPIPPNVAELLKSCGRSEVVERGSNPIKALIAQCERLCGQAHMESERFGQASESFLAAVQLVNQEEVPHHFVAKELASHYHAAEQKVRSQAQPQSPSTPEAVAMAGRKPFEMGGSLTPPPRKASDMESFTRTGAATPSTRNCYDSPSGYKFMFNGDSATPSPSARVERKCNHCGAPPPTEGRLKICSRCRKACFCSQECLVAAWEAGHSQVCEEAEPRRSPAPASTSS